MRVQVGQAVVFLLFLFSATVLAAPQGATAIVTASAPIFLRPGAETPLRVAKVDTVLKVLREEGEWVEVEFNDPQFGRRVGWVEKKLVRISRPELEPMDLSVKEAVRSAEAAPTASERPQPRTQETAPAAPPSRPGFHRGWLDVNIGAAGSAQKSVKTELTVFDADGEFATYRVGYNAPTGAEFDFGGGFMFTPVLGFGIQFTGTAHQGEADLFIRIPHPRFFDAHANDSGTTEEKLDRVEGSVNLSLVAAVPLSNRNLSFRIYGGPTYFRLEADAVSDIRYFQQFGLFTTVNTVEITSWESEKVEETGWGFHVGADIGYFFSRHVGVGGFARVTRGTVTFRTEDFLVDEDLDVKVGGFQAGGGLRIRF